MLALGKKHQTARQQFAPALAPAPLVLPAGSVSGVLPPPSPPLRWCDLLGLSLGYIFVLTPNSLILCNTPHVVLYAYRLTHSAPAPLLAGLRSRHKIVVWCNTISGYYLAVLLGSFFVALPLTPPLGDSPPPCTAKKNFYEKK